MLCAIAQSISFGNYTGTEALAEWGTNKAETYSVAMKINDASLVGMKVTGVRIPVNATAPDIAEYSAFLSKNLPTATSGKATGDIVNKEFTPDGEWNVINFAEPYVIEEGGFYAGYTFRVTKLDIPAGDGKPLVLMVGTPADGFYILTSRTYRKWTDAVVSVGGALAMQVLIENAGAVGNAVAVSDVKMKKVKVQEQSFTTATIVNHGLNPVENIDYKLVINGQESEGHATLDTPLTADFYGASTDISIDIPALPAKGEYAAELTVTKVNGEANAEVNPSAAFIMKTVNVVPRKVPLMEEFTGAWCGFCPSGYIGMKLMNERHPGEFVCASYHNGDAMQITENYPVTVEGFPDAWFDRKYQVDPYRGVKNYDMGIDDTWQELCTKDTPANVSVSGSVNEETGEVTITSTYEMCEDISGAKFGIAYLITADGLSGKGTNWRQHNYYSQDYQNGAYSGMYNEGMEQFNYGAEYQYLEYDDVVIGTSCAGDALINGVINTEVSEGDVFTHTYTMNTADMKSNYGTKANLAQHIDRLNAIAVLYDLNSHEIANCAKCTLVVDAGESDGVKDVNAAVSAADGTARTFNVLGQRVGNVKGIAIINGRKVIK